MDFRTLIAIILMLVVYYFSFVPQGPAPKSPATPAATEQSQGVAPKASATPVVEKPRTEMTPADNWAQLRSKQFLFINDKVELEMNAAGEILSAKFLQFPLTTESDEPTTHRFNSNRAFGGSRLYIAGQEAPWRLESQSETQLVLKAQSSAFSATRKIELLPSSYILSVTDEIVNASGQSIESSPEINLADPIDPERSAGFFEQVLMPQSEFQKLLVYADDSLTAKPYKDAKIGNFENPQSISWTGFGTKYLLFAAMPMNSSLLSLQVSRDTEKVIQSMRLNPKQIPPSDTASFQYSLYIGPKKIDELENLDPKLTRAIEYGNWIGPISRVLLQVLLFFESIVKNFGIAIILLTISVKLLLYPLAYKAAVSMRKLSIVQPKMMEIREKYKGDSQRMNMEMMNLYRNEKVNPVGGCLPILLQMPVFFALYRVFFASIEMRHEPFFGWIQDLAAYDPYFITPVLMTALMYFQQKLTPIPQTGADNEAVRIQKAMFKWMPFFFGAIMLFLPAGLTLYFLVNAGLSIVQQLLMNRKLDRLYPRPAAPSLKVVNGV